MWNGTEDDTLFHTGYVWLGSSAHTVTVNLDAWPADTGNAALELRVHQKPTWQPDDVICSRSIAVALKGRERVHVCLHLTAEDGCSYAVLGQVTTGACWVDNAAVQISAGWRGSHGRVAAP